MRKSKELKKLPPTFDFYFNIGLHLTLFVIFVVFFGIPSVSKYLDQETIIISSEEETNGIEAPAITFLSHKNHLGWKSDVGNIQIDKFNMVDHCKKIGLTDFQVCISNGTFGLGDFLMGARMKSIDKKDLLLESSNSLLLTEDVTTTRFGRFFTLKFHRTITRNHSDFIVFKMDTTSSFFYSVFIHDESFFLMNQNPFRKKSV